jgi:uncharacterized protein
MRKKEKEIAGLSDIEAILQKAEICRLGINDTAAPYIVPLNFGYKNMALYFHTGREGKKIDLLKKNNLVSFEAEAETEILRSDKACGWNTRYRSVMGTGKAFFINDREEIKKALDIIMDHYSTQASWEYRDEVIDKDLTVIKVEIEGMIGKKSG